MPLGIRHDTPATAPRIISRESSPPGFARTPEGVPLFRTRRPSDVAATILRGRTFDVIDVDPKYLLIGFGVLLAILGGVMWYFSEGKG